MFDGVMSNTLYVGDERMSLHVKQEINRFFLDDHPDLNGRYELWRGSADDPRSFLVRTFSDLEQGQAATILLNMNDTPAGW